MLLPLSCMKNLLCLQLPLIKNLTTECVHAFHVSVLGVRTAIPLITTVSTVIPAITAQGITDTEFIVAQELIRTC